MKIVGINPFDGSRQGKALLAELQKIGFRLSDLEYCEEIPETGEGWYMLFGSPALKQYCGPDVRMSDVSGELLFCEYNPDALIVPNYAPGFIYYNANLKGLWRDNLEQAYIYYQLDEKGLVA